MCAPCTTPETQACKQFQRCARKGPSRLAFAVPGKVTLPDGTSSRCCLLGVVHCGGATRANRSGRIQCLTWHDMHAVRPRLGTLAFFRRRCTGCRTAVTGCSRSSRRRSTAWSPGFWLQDRLHVLIFLSIPSHSSMAAGLHAAGSKCHCAAAHVAALQFVYSLTDKRGLQSFEYSYTSPALNILVQSGFELSIAVHSLLWIST